MRHWIRHSVLYQNEREIAISGLKWFHSKIDYYVRIKQYIYSVSPPTPQAGRNQRRPKRSGLGAGRPHPPPPPHIPKPRRNGPHIPKPRRNGWKPNRSGLVPAPPSSADCKFQSVRHCAGSGLMMISGLDPLEVPSTSTAGGMLVAHE